MRGFQFPFALLRVSVALLVALMAAFPAAASVAASPSTATVSPGDATPLITLNVGVPPGPSVANAVFTGLPPGASVVPATVVLLYSLTGNATATFEIVTTGATPPGTYPIVISAFPDFGAGLGMFVLIVASPDFQTSVSPNPVSVAWGGSVTTRVTTVPLFGFSSDISYAFTGLRPGITASSPQVASVPYAPLDFQISVVPRTPPGVYPASLVATWSAFGLQTRTIPFSVIVQPPTLTAAFSPPAITVAPGGTAASSAIVLTPGNGYSGTPALTWDAIPAGLEITPLTLPSPALPPTQSVPVTVRATGATPGSYQLTARAVDAVARVDAPAILVVTVSPPPDASISVLPPVLTVAAGHSAAVTVTATGTNGFAGSLDVTAPNSPQVTFQPATFTLRAGESRTVTVQAAATATPGSSVAVFSATSTALTGSRTASLALTIAAPAPEITSATPPVLTSGSLGVAMRLVGLNFKPGAVVTFTPPGPIVQSTNVASPTLAIIVVDTPAGTAVGHYRVDLRNPDGGATATGVPVLVAPASSLGAPLSVPTAAVVFPRPYTAVRPAEAVYPRAVLATTGVGTIIGTWRFDGVPFDQFVVAASGGSPVEVTSKMPIPVATSGEHRLELVVEQPQHLATEAVPIIVSVESNSGLRVLEPDDGATISLTDAMFRWTIVPGATGYEIEIVRAGNHFSTRVRLSDSRWSPAERAIATLGAGRHRFRVAAIFPGEVHGAPSQWREFVVPEVRVASSGTRCASCTSPSGANFRLVSLQSPEAEESATSEAAQPAEPPRDWALTLLGTATATDEDALSVADAARLQLTTAGDLQDVAYFTKWTGDLSGRKDLDPEYDTAAENRAWQIEGGATQSRTREELRAGYSPPEFLDQSEFLSAGLARGGILGKVATPLGSVSLYDTFHDDAAGAVSVYDLKQRVSGAAWEAPGDTNRSLLRVFGLRARGEGTETAETEAEAIGVFWRYVSSPALSVIVEGAHGTLDGGLQPGFEDLDGSGLHLGASGARGTLAWGVNFRDVDAGMVNPANLGLSAGGVPDRVGGDLSLAKSFGTTMLSLQLGTQQSGTLADGSGANVDERSGILSLVSPVSSSVVASATASATTTEGDGEPALGLPGSDRTMLSLGVTLSETFGALSVAEALSWQDLSDDVTSAFDSTVTSGSITAGGALGQSVIVSALLSGTRSESPEPIGTTDMWLLSLQPSFNLAGASLAITPRVSYTRIDSDLGATSDTELYGLIVQWSPPWRESFFNVQVGSDWNRSSTDGLPTPDFDHRIVASLTLRWGLSRASLAATPPAPLPAVPMTSEHARARGAAIGR
ncbi:MAG: hypothetical protein WC538_07180 [Thermoanaerobaculia bacterium]|jgi:hypothetical protein